MVNQNIKYFHYNYHIIIQIPQRENRLSKKSSFEDQILDLTDPKHKILVHLLKERESGHEAIRGLRVIDTLSHTPCQLLYPCSPWTHTYTHITLHHIKSHHITSHHITSQGSFLIVFKCC